MSRRVSISIRRLSVAVVMELGIVLSDLRTCSQAGVAKGLVPVALVGPIAAMLLVTLLASILKTTP